MSSIRELNSTQPSSPFWDFVSDLDANTRPPTYREPRQRDSQSTSTMGGGPEESQPTRAGPSTDAPPPPPPFPTAEPHHEEDSDHEPHEHRRGGRHAHGHHGHHHHHHPHAHGGPGGRGGRGGRGGPWGRGRGGFGGPRHMPWDAFLGGRGGDFNPERLAQAFGSMFGQQHPWAQDREDLGENDFRPEVDVFDTADSYVLNVALPGAKKEDIGVNWHPETSELQISGVVYRIGGEEFLATLALDERKVGVFDRKVKLGSAQAPALVKENFISAKLEDGVLIVDVPKAQKETAGVRRINVA